MIKLLTLSLLLTSCGASLDLGLHNTSGNKRNRNNAPVVNEYTYTRCSFYSYRSGCQTIGTVRYLLNPNYFYGRLCYDNYMRCINHQGVNFDFK
jgi:hypothetical protein